MLGDNSEPTVRCEALNMQRELKNPLPIQLRHSAFLSCNLRTSVLGESLVLSSYRGEGRLDRINTRVPAIACLPKMLLAGFRARLRGDEGNVRIRTEDLFAYVCVKDCFETGLAVDLL
jgi:hypothetical protein